jgi:hypothetical protein
MRVSECARRVVLRSPTNVTRLEERKKIDQLGQEIAVREGMHYEGYSVSVAEPYSLEQAKTVLYFN